MSAIDGLGEHQSGRKLQRDCVGCLALSGRVRHYECQVCFRMIPWCNGAADELDRAYGGICDQCAAPRLDHAIAAGSQSPGADAGKGAE